MLGVIADLALWHLLKSDLLVALVHQPTGLDHPGNVYGPGLAVLLKQALAVALLLFDLALLSARLTAGGLAMQAPTSPPHRQAPSSYVPSLAKCFFVVAANRFAAVPRTKC